MILLWIILGVLWRALVILAVLAAIGLAVAIVTAPAWYS